MTLSNVQNGQIKSMVDYQLRKLNKYYGTKYVLYLIVPYAMKINGKKENVDIKDVTMIDPVTVWSEKPSAEC